MAEEALRAIHAKLAGADGSVAIVSRSLQTTGDLETQIASAQHVIDESIARVGSGDAWGLAGSSKRAGIAGDLRMSCLCAIEPDERQDYPESMRVGYACINTALDCRASRTFRLASYSEERLVDTLAQNLQCLQEMLRWNLQHGIRFFRLTSDLVPFGSHEVNTFPWQREFGDIFERIGAFVAGHGMRVSLHPGQYTLLNSVRSEVVERAVADLRYHVSLLDLMKLDHTHKVQIHVGGVYGDKQASLERFANVYSELPQAIRARLVIENDERLYDLQDCLALSRALGVPVVFDVFHHSILNQGEDFGMAVEHAARTWSASDGSLIVDYSNQEPNARLGAHSQTIDVIRFQEFVSDLPTEEVDVMLEVKDKQASVLKLEEAGIAIS